MAQYINQFQPRRDQKNMMFRTHPRLAQSQGKLYRSCELPNMITQIQLYRYTFHEHFATQIAISDLHDYLVGRVPFISKKHLGAAVLNSLDYDPRKLKGVTKDNDKATMTYIFAGGPLELRYGLEWMICAWYRRFLMSEGTHESDLDTPEKVAWELNLLGTESHEDYVEDVLGPLRRMETNYPEPDWRRLMKEANLVSHGRVNHDMAERREKPKDLS
tara:strand:- start:731 stop:1381 length:651 start_codon:yes stop_codon:yes gene_type:complete